MKHQQPVSFGALWETLKDTPKPGNARATDPASSHLAAAEVVASGQVSRNVARVVEGLMANPGATARELAGLIGMDRTEASRRTSDAEEKGLIRKGPLRLCKAGGRMSVTWEVVA